MEKIIEFLKYIANGKIVFCTIQIIFLLLWINAERIEKGWFTKKDNLKKVVTRGEKSIEKFYLTYVVTSLIVIEIISNAKFLGDYKVTFMILNLLILTRLSFFNSWYRNKIIGFSVKTTNKREFDNRE